MLDFFDSLRAGPSSDGPAQLVEKPCLKEKSPFLQGEYEGAGAPSYGIECLQKACVSRRLRRAAAAFRPAARAEKRGIVKAVEKVEHSWAFSHLYGKISMGDERCLNEGSWIVES